MNKLLRSVGSFELPSHIFQLSTKLRLARLLALRGSLSVFFVFSGKHPGKGGRNAPCLK
jgi:hypothetical protein